MPCASDLNIAFEASGGHFNSYVLYSIAGEDTRVHFFHFEPRRDGVVKNFGHCTPHKK